MKIAKLKVRPRKGGPQNPCTVQLSAMLGCWAVNKDLANTAGCAEAAKLLHECMRNAPARQKPYKPTINYHLARLNKQL